MAAAGVTYRVGRESMKTYNENLAGKKVDMRGGGYSGVDPYVQKKNSTSGLLFGIETSVSPNMENFTGSSDDVRIQSFNFRLPLTRVRNNSVPFGKPENYDVTHFELLLRFFEANHTTSFTQQLMPNLKTDSNSNGQISFDLLGGQYDWKSALSYSEMSYAQRRDVYKRHKEWQQGYLYTLSTNERIPASVRKQVSTWGYAKDEFVDNGFWPYQLYVREARRMNGLYTYTQKDVQKDMNYGDDVIIGLASYSLDSHVVRRVVVSGQIYNEGGFYVGARSASPIPYNVIVPAKTEADNFLNPVTVSASHVSLGTIRMEPTYMILGQAAGTAAVMAIEEGKAVQDIDRKALYNRLVQDKQKMI